PGAAEGAWGRPAGFDPQKGRSSSSSSRAPGKSSKSSPPPLPPPDGAALAAVLRERFAAGASSKSPPPRFGPESMISSRTLISVEYRVCPSLSCHCRYSIRPSTNSLSPFFTYRSTMSASCENLVFQTTQRCHSVFSCFSFPCPIHVRLVASEKVATRPPLDVERISGSFPRFPINCTLFKLRLTISSCPG